MIRWSLYWGTFIPSLTLTASLQLDADATALVGSSNLGALRALRRMLGRKGGIPRFAVSQAPGAKGGVLGAWPAAE